ncbi:TetR/AcrR family transcriptional regulator [Listeria weihenstephanensis]|uniref:TetR/AcrR family transcriptional regulator n=1 Tax=Listeria weihenstephanensis TaxID=1006155 RepID=A0A841Z6Z0_9LIST|nr:TetR/AcrR family transcriptional regulator [Listeria weihenstephanensis]MBC1501791.1 TetR/AcrR family transcriptional regulator [Listeria weihenstephanensis]
MTSSKTDPRITRTRQLILDAFSELLHEKEFEDITVKDIAAKATVNRTTFYAHFEDKFLLLEYVITEAFTQIVSNRIDPNTRISEESMRGLILSMCDYQYTVFKECRIHFSSIASLIETAVRAKLQEIIVAMFANTHPAQESTRQNVLAIIISSAIYEATKYWVVEAQDMTPEALADEILAFSMPAR